MAQSGIREVTASVHPFWLCTFESDISWCQTRTCKRVLLASPSDVALPFTAAVRNWCTKSMGCRQCLSRIAARGWLSHCCGRQHLWDAGLSVGCGLEAWGGGGGRVRAGEVVCGFSHMNVLLFIIKAGSSPLSCKGPECPTKLSQWALLPLSCSLKI